jgi:hypothetical protein
MRPLVSPPSAPMHPVSTPAPPSHLAWYCCAALLPPAWPGPGRGSPWSTLCCAGACANGTGSPCCIQGCPRPVSFFQGGVGACANFGPESGWNLNAPTGRGLFKGLIGNVPVPVQLIHTLTMVVQRSLLCDGVIVRWRYFVQLLSPCVCPRVRLQRICCTSYVGTTFKTALGRPTSTAADWSILAWNGPRRRRLKHCFAPKKHRRG